VINSGLRYQCSFRAMIEDWRAKWAEGTDGATNPDLPFGWAQLNSCSNTGVASNYQSPVKNVPSEDDPLSAWNSLTHRGLSRFGTILALRFSRKMASGSRHQSRVPKE
jgi:hypothetical protein